jgi:predicted alpha/beta-hydrolase family hydrolase
VDGLLLLSYPLHPPRKPAELRTAHFPNLRTPALFVHGSRDPFATTEELRKAMALIPGHVNLLEIEGAWHDLGKDHASVASNIVSAFLRDPALARA